MLEQSDMIGSWSLVAAEETGPDAGMIAPPFGGKPKGMLHYLADGRMVVVIQNADRPPIEGGRRGGSDAEWRGAARSFTAYAGTYSILPGQVVHHVDLNSFPNDIGVDYVRLARMENGRLILETPSELPPDQRPMRLVWQKYDGT